MEIKCYGICSDMCVYQKDGECSIHAVNVNDADEQEESTERNL